MLTIDKDEVLLTALHIAEANLQTASQIIQRQNETIERFKAARRGANVAEVLLVLPLVVQMFQTIFAASKPPTPAQPPTSPRADAGAFATKRDLRDALAATFAADSKAKKDAA